WRCATPRSGPRPPETAAPRPAPSRRRRRSFENLHQAALIAVLDAGGPVVAVLQVQDVQQQHARRVLILDPDSARRAGYDARQDRPPTRRRQGPAGCLGPAPGLPGRNGRAAPAEYGQGPRRGCRATRSAPAPPEPPPSSGG